MIKYLQASPYLPDGSPTVEKVTSGLVKSAAAYPPQLQEFLRTLKRIKGSLYYISSALGCEEKWGDNSNGDAFPEDDLSHTGPEYGYETFVHHGKPFRGHRNTDPEKGFGDIPFSMYNSEMGRVYVVMRIDTTLPHFSEIQDVVEAYDKGDPVATSMGCKVLHDVCSICGNKAPTREDYCVHARYHMGEIYPDGRKVFVRNPKPRFFDNSFVRKGADASAFILAKVASEGKARIVVPSVEMAETVYGKQAIEELEKGSGDKASEMEKEVPCDTEKVDDVERVYGPFLDDGARKLKASEPELPDDVIDDLAGHDLSEILSTLCGLGIDLKPGEFQKTILIKQGERGLAERLERDGITFGDDALKFVPETPKFAIDHKSVRWDLLEKLARNDSLMQNRSGYRPFVLARTVDLVKRAADGHPGPVPESFPTKSPLPLLAAIGGAYFAARKMAMGASGFFQGFEKDMIRRPWVLPLIVLGSITAPKIFSDIFGRGASTPVDTDHGTPYSPPGGKQAAFLDRPLYRFGVGLPAAYMLSGHNEAKSYAGKEPGVAGSFLRDHPGAVALGFGLFGGVASRSLRGQLGKWVQKGKKLTKTSSVLGKDLAMLEYLQKEARFADFPPESVDEIIIQSLVKLPEDGK